MNKMQVFENEEFGRVRAVEINGSTYFIGKEVAAILGYVNPRKALIDHVDEEDKGVTKCDTLGGMQDLVVINESGLYSLILSSKMPNARYFKRWVTTEVLPAIRKHGVYTTEELLANPDMLIESLLALKEERNKNRSLATTVAVQNQQIAEMRPKVSYYDIVLQCKDLVAISVIAKDYGMSAKRLNSFLHKYGIQYRQGRLWLLYQKYAEKGYTSTRTFSTPDADGEMHAHHHTYWTQKGRLFIYGLLKANGIFPIVEQESENYGCR